MSHKPLDCIPRFLGTASLLVSAPPMKETTPRPDPQGSSIRSQHSTASLFACSVLPPRGARGSGCNHKKPDPASCHQDYRRSPVASRCCQAKSSIALSLSHTQPHDPLIPFLALGVGLPLVASPCRLGLRALMRGPLPPLPGRHF